MDVASEGLGVTRGVDQTEIATRISAEFTAFVENASFPCLAGKGVVHRGDHILRVYDGLGTETAAVALAADLA